jgi:hypothetical protein
MIENGTENYIFKVFTIVVLKSPLNFISGRTNHIIRHIYTGFLTLFLINVEILCMEQLRAADYSVDLVWI